jgi:nucleoporin SEH1
VYTSLDPSLNDWTTAHDVYVPGLPAPGAADDGAANGEGGDTTQGGWGLSWCKEKWWGSILAVFHGTNPSVKVNTPT